MLEQIFKNDIAAFWRVYSNLFFAILFVALPFNLGVPFWKSLVIGSLVFFSPMLRRYARGPALLIMVLMLVQWADLLPIERWTRGLVAAADHALL